MRHVRERGSSLLDRGERRPVVQGRDLGSQLDRRQHPVVEQRRTHDEIPEVDDPVPDGIDGHELLDRARLLAFDDAQLEAGRAGVDDEDIQNGHVQPRISGSSSPCSLV